MANNKAFSLAEIMIAMVVLAFLATLTIPSMVESTLEKTYYKGYQKAFKTVSRVVNEYLAIDTNYFDNTEDSAALFARFFIENANIKELYAEGEPTKKSETYSCLKFKSNISAGAKNPNSISNTISIREEPSFWFVTDDNLAYTIVKPKLAHCNEVLNINTSKNLDFTLRNSCFAVIVDTNGLLVNPNKIEDKQDISDEEYLPSLKNDRYYIFIGTNGTAVGNPKHILMAKIYSGKSNLQFYN